MSGKKDKAEAPKVDAKKDAPQTPEQHKAAEVKKAKAEAKAAAKAARPEYVTTKACVFGGKMYDADEEFKKEGVDKELFESLLKSKAVKRG